MNDSLMIADSTLESSLTACGWQYDEHARAWNLETSAGPAQMRRIEERTGWLRFRLIGGALPASNNHRVLIDNFTLEGPAKLVTSSSVAPLFRVDVPQQFAISSGERYVSDGEIAAEPWQHFAESLTTLVAGGDSARSSATQSADTPQLDQAAVLEELTRLGWAGSIDDGQLGFNFSLPGVFRKARIEPHAAGLRIAADLADLSGYDEASLTAALRLAYEVNERLPLVRLACDEANAPRLVRAEVWLGALPVPGSWLAAGLEVVEAAVALAARELAALRDTQLANLVLAAPRPQRRNG